MQENIFHYITDHFMKAKIPVRDCENPIEIYDNLSDCDN